MVEDKSFDLKSLIFVFKLRKSDSNENTVIFYPGLTIFWQCFMGKGFAIYEATCKKALSNV